jgi:methionyl aminopeptidase
MLIKTPEQIDGIRKSCRLARSCLEFIEPHVLPGVTTRHLNDLLEAYITDNKAIPAPKGYQGFPAATCISVNEVVCHGIPSEYVLKEGDIVNIDVTTVLNGYYGDTSTTFAVGDISDEARRLLSVAEQALQMGIRQVKPYAYFSNIGKAIEPHVNRHGYSVVHQFCGHGVGLAFHEPPQVNHTVVWESILTMAPGMTFTIEPSVNVGLAEVVVDKVDKWTVRTVDGSLSAQYEHTVLVTETGVEVLT